MGQKFTIFLFFLFAGIENNPDFQRQHPHKTSVTVTPLSESPHFVSARHQREAPRAGNQLPSRDPSGQWSLRRTHTEDSQSSQASGSLCSSRDPLIPASTLKDHNSKFNSVAAPWDVKSHSEGSGHHRHSFGRSSRDERWPDDPKPLHTAHSIGSNGVGSSPKVHSHHSDSHKSKYHAQLAAAKEHDRFRDSLEGKDFADKLTRFEHLTHQKRNVSSTLSNSVRPGYPDAAFSYLTPATAGHPPTLQTASVVSVAHHRPVTSTVSAPACSTAYLPCPSSSSSPAKSPTDRSPLPWEKAYQPVSPVSSPPAHLSLAQTSIHSPHRSIAFPQPTGHPAAPRAEFLPKFPVEPSDVQHHREKESNTPESCNSLGSESSQSSGKKTTNFSVQLNLSDSGDPNVNTVHANTPQGIRVLKSQTATEVPPPSTDSESEPLPIYDNIYKLHLYAQQRRAYYESQKCTGAAEGISESGINKEETEVSKGEPKPNINSEPVSVEAVTPDSNSQESNVLLASSKDTRVYKATTSPGSKQDPTDVPKSCVDVRTVEASERTREAIAVEEGKQEQVNKAATTKKPPLFGLTKGKVKFADVDEIISKSSDKKEKVKVSKGEKSHILGVKARRGSTESDASSGSNNSSVGSAESKASVRSKDSTDSSKDTKSEQVTQERGRSLKKASKSPERSRKGLRGVKISPDRLRGLFKRSPSPSPDRSKGKKDKKDSARSPSKSETTEQPKSSKGKKSEASSKKKEKESESKTVSDHQAPTTENIGEETVLVSEKVVVLEKSKDPETVKPAQEEVESTENQQAKISTGEILRGKSEENTSESDSSKSSKVPSITKEDPPAVGVEEELKSPPVVPPHVDDTPPPLPERIKSKSEAKDFLKKKVEVPVGENSVTVEKTGHVEQNGSNCEVEVSTEEDFLSVAIPAPLPDHLNHDYDQVAPEEAEYCEVPEANSEDDNPWRVDLNQRLKPDLNDFKGEKVFTKDTAVTRVVIPSLSQTKAPTVVITKKDNEESTSGCYDLGKDQGSLKKSPAKRDSGEKGNSLKRDSSRKGSGDSGKTGSLSKLKKKLDSSSSVKSRPDSASSGSSNKRPDSAKTEPKPDLKRQDSGSKLKDIAAEFKRQDSKAKADKNTPSSQRSSDVGCRLARQGPETSKDRRDIATAGSSKDSECVKEPGELTVTVTEVKHRPQHLTLDTNLAAETSSHHGHGHSPKRQGFVAVSSTDLTSEILSELNQKGIASKQADSADTAEEVAQPPPLPKSPPPPPPKEQTAAPNSEDNTMNQGSHSHITLGVKVLPHGGGGFGQNGSASEKVPTPEKDDPIPNGNSTDDTASIASSIDDLDAIVRGTLETVRRLDDQVNLKKVQYDEISMDSLDIDDLTASQQDLRSKAVRMKAERKREQYEAAMERQRLDEILSMCAEYEKQLEREKPEEPMSPKDQRRGNDVRNSMTKIKTNGSLTKLASPTQGHKEFGGADYKWKRNSSSSTSEEESSEHGTIKRRPGLGKNPPVASPSYFDMDSDASGFFSGPNSPFGDDPGTPFSMESQASSSGSKHSSSMEGTFECLTPTNTSPRVVHKKPATPNGDICDHIATSVQTSTSGGRKKSSKGPPVPPKTFRSGPQSPTSPVSPGAMSVTSSTSTDYSDQSPVPATAAQRQRQAQRLTSTQVR